MKETIMEAGITLHIIIESPPPGVGFGLQKGRGSNYETVQKQTSGAKDLHFKCKVSIKEMKDGSVNLLGPFVQGPPSERFIYIDIGTCAGQTNTPWSRRLKIPLSGIAKDMIQELAKDPQMVVQCRVPGTGKDGGPSCATVKPFSGWKIKKTTI
jgi:hypothetical protein